MFWYLRVKWGSQNLKCQVLSKFQFGGGGGVNWTKSQIKVNWDFGTQIYPTATSTCFTDSLSHTPYVETND